MKGKVQDRNKWAEQRYKLFNEKIDSFKSHKAYSSWLRQYADDAIKWNEMYLLSPINWTQTIV